VDLARLAGAKKEVIFAKLESVLGLKQSDDDAAFTVDCDDAELLLLEMGYEVTRGRQSKAEGSASERAARRAAEAHQPRRAPVVCVMGHVDHGKTTLLDALRNDAARAHVAASGTVSVSDLAAGEAGGITQRVAAFRVATPEGDDGAGFMTVIDTPGHAAFSGMRASGACGTDVVVVVVAGDSGVQPQTEEVLEVARAHNCAVIVAVTKMDRFPDPRERDEVREKVQKQLMERGWVCEAYGGEVPIVECSGKTGVGLEELKEVIALQVRG